MAAIMFNLLWLPAGYSDGTIFVWPLFHPTITYTMRPDPLALLSAEFNRVPGYVQDLGGEVEFWDGLPDGYVQYSHPRSNGRLINEIFGHPSGGHWSSVRTFLVHVVHIMRLGGRTLAQCPCELCRPVPRKPAKKKPASSGKKGGPAGRKGRAKKTAAATASEESARGATAPGAVKA